MMVDYDIVIVGGSLAGRYAAVFAKQLQATVALVEPPGSLRKSLLAQHPPHVIQQIHGVAARGVRSLHATTAPTSSHAGLHPAVMQWAEGVVSNLEAQNSPAVLATLGIDVVIGSGQFESLPHLAFSVNNRRLRARAYLIATGSHPLIPQIKGLQATGYITAAEVLLRLTSPKPPLKWVILGGEPSGVQLAQALNQLGLEVTLVVRGAHILAKEDPEVAQLLQATLEAEGVHVLTQTSVSQVQQIEDKKWLYTGEQAIEADEILLSAGQQPDIKALNLAAVGVKRHRYRLHVNEKLQTTNPRIYACGDVVGGYQLPNIAIYEAKIALKNALFLPVFKVNYRGVPWSLFCQPQFAQVGLTEAQARCHYASGVLILRQYFKTVAAAQLTGETTGICKLIVLRNGEILGATLFGSQAGELVNLIALAINNRLNIAAIARLAPVYPAMAEIFNQIGVTWAKISLVNNTKSNLLASFWNYRRWL